MASEQHWLSRKARLLHPEWGPLASVPMDHVVLIGNGPALSVADAFEFLLLGMKSEADQLLEFVPRLEATLRDPKALSHLPEHRQREAAADLRENLLVARWLQRGRFDSALAQECYDRLLDLNRWWTTGRFTGANLLHLMLLALEAGNERRAVEDYLRNEKHAEDLPAAKLARNARALLYAHIRPAGAWVEPGAVVKARERFRAAASRWERGLQPIPYVGQLELARILHACYAVAGEPLSLVELLEQVRGA